MALKVEIYEKDIVRPFFPTPQSLRNYNLSLCDQGSGTHDIPLLLFYNSSSSGSYDELKLKESLSKTLSILYPVAGRVKDGLTIECNDEGVEFVVASVTNYALADFLRLPNVRNLLQQLLPREPFPFHHSQPMLGVQVNKFRCGGMAVAISLWHGVGDATALAGFIKTWAAINRGEVGVGESKDKDSLISIKDATKLIFPPQQNFDFSTISSSYAAIQKMSIPKYSNKRFVFSKQEIERMRNEHNISNRHRRPTRVEALSALIWAAVIRATIQADANHDPKTVHTLIQIVDLRNRINPPLPSMCLANMIYGCAARWAANNKTDGIVTSQSLIGRIREASTKVNDEYIKKIMQPQAEMASLRSNANPIKLFIISSLCGLRFHETNFGWGKPIWNSLATTPQESAFFYDTSDGGIEVCIGLTHQVMTIFDKDEFLAHVSAGQIIPARL